MTCVYPQTSTEASSNNPSSISEEEHDSLASKARQTAPSSSTAGSDASWLHRLICEISIAMQARSSMIVNDNVLIKVVQSKLLISEFVKSRLGAAIVHWRGLSQPVIARFTRLSCCTATRHDPKPSRGTL